MSYDLKDLPAYIDRLWNNLITSQVPTDFGNVTYYGLLRDCLLMVKKLATTWNEKSADFDSQINSAVDLINQATELLNSINIDVEALQEQVNEALANIMKDLAEYLESEEFTQQINNAVNEFVTDERLQNIIESMKPFHFSDVSLETPSDKTAFSNAVSSNSNALLRTGSETQRTMNDNLLLINNKYLASKDSNSITRNICGMDSDLVILGDLNMQTYLRSKNNPIYYNGTDFKNLLSVEDANLKYLPFTNPTLPADSELRGTKNDGSAIPLITIRELLNSQEFVMLGASGMPIGFAVTDSTTRPIVVRTGSISDYVAFQSDIPDVVNNLTSTDTDKSLSANQGRVLNTNINNINTTLTKNLKLKVDKYGLSVAEVNTGLTLVDKPIYSKTFYKMTGITGITNFDVNIANVDDIWIDPSNSFVKTNSHSFTIPKTTIQTDSGASFTSIASNTIETYLNKNTSTNYTLVVSCGNNVVGDTINKIVVTIKYTKTTD